MSQEPTEPTGNNQDRNAAPVDEGQFDLHRAASIKFAFQIILTTWILLFCGFKIWTSPVESESSQYKLIATTLFAWWCPSPKP